MISNGCLGNRPKPNEHLNFGARPPARERGWRTALGTDWRRPHSLELRTQWNCQRKFCRRFDRAVSQKRVGRRQPGNGRRRNHNSYQLNEHGPALKVFWSRGSGMGALSIARKTRKDKDPEAFNMKKRDKNGTERLLGNLCARTRWVTERIASLRDVTQRKRSGIERRNDRFELVL